MIGSHDTFTFLKPTHGLYNHFTRLWRTQCRTIKEQYEWGVRFFDLRVVRYKDNWAFAHGLVTFPILFNSIMQICNYMQFSYPLAVYRIVLERGSNKDERLFVSEINNLRVNNFLNRGNINLWLADIKKNKIWRGQVLNRTDELYNRGFFFTRNSCTWTEPNKELHGEVNVHNFWKVDLKTEARKINTNLGMCDLSKLQDMYEDPTRLYFLDYCTNEYD